MSTLYGTNFFAVVEDNPNLSIALKDGNGLATLAKWDGAGAIPTTAGIFNHGCQMIWTATGLGTAANYENTGSTAAPVWSALGNGALTFTPDELTAETIQIIDDATAATKNPVFASKTIGAEWEFCIETLPTGATQPDAFGATVTSLANVLGMKRDHIDEHMVHVTLNAGPPAGQEVFFRPTEFKNGVCVGVLVSNHLGATTADWDFTSVDIATGLVAQEQIPVIKDANAAIGGYGVFWDPAAADGSRITVDSQFADTCFVRSQSGRYMQLPNGAAGDPIFFNEAAVSSNVRLESVGASGTNLMLSFNGDLFVDKTTKGYLFAAPAITPNAVNFQVALGTVTPYGAGEKVKVRINDRILTATVSAAPAGERVFYDASAAVGSRLRANFTTGNKTVALSTTERPEGYQTTGVVS